MNMDNVVDRLNRQKQELERRYQAINRDFRNGRSADFAEQATENENNDVLMGLREEARDELNQITSALHRVETGEYGYCRSCGEEIQAERLEALPYASQCVNCAN